MASPLEWGTGTALVGLILLVLLGAYAGVIVVLMLAILIASAMFWRMVANAAAKSARRVPAAWALWSVAGLTVAAIVLGTISDPMLGAAMFFSAVAGGVVGFLFRLKGWL